VPQFAGCIKTTLLIDFPDRRRFCYYFCRPTKHDLLAGFGFCDHSTAEKNSKCMLHFHHASTKIDSRPAIRPDYEWFISPSTNILRLQEHPEG